MKKQSTPKLLPPNNEVKHLCVVMQGFFPPSFKSLASKLLAPLLLIFAESQVCVQRSLSFVASSDDDAVLYIQYILSLAFISLFKAPSYSQVLTTWQRHPGFKIIVFSKVPDDKRATKCPKA